jgi:hypothetical protein
MIAPQTAKNGLFEWREGDLRFDACVNCKLSAVPAEIRHDLRYSAHVGGELITMIHTNRIHRLILNKWHFGLVSIMPVSQIPSRR